MYVVSAMFRSIKGVRWFSSVLIPKLKLFLAISVTGWRQRVHLVSKIHMGVSVLSISDGNLFFWYILLVKY